MIVIIILDPIEVPMNKRCRPIRRRSGHRDWSAILGELRASPNEWRRLRDPMSRSLACQLASDLRNAHRREPGRFRIRALEPTDRFDAVWGHDPTRPRESACYLWIRWRSAALDTEGRSRR